MAKIPITVVLDSLVKKKLEARAKKELMTLEELINDILRRSVVLYKGKSSVSDKVDDKFITLFSRKAKKYSKKNYVK